MAQFTLMSIVTDKCNFKCSHCSTDSSRGKSSVTNKHDIFSALEDNAGKFESTRHLISGGEPVLYPDLYETLEYSRNLGVDTSIVTNASWVNVNDHTKSGRLLERFIPAGVNIFSSLDFYHLSQDPLLEQKISLLEKMSRGRNVFQLDGAYNGTEELDKLLELINGRWDFKPIQVQRIGRGKDIYNLGKIDDPKIYCPKRDNKGFTIAPSGVYFCFRSALNRNERMKISDRYDSEMIADFFNGHSTHSLNVKLKKKYVEVKDEVNYVCDVCERL